MNNLGDSIAGNVYKYLQNSFPGAIHEDLEDAVQTAILKGLKNGKVVISNSKDIKWLNITARNVLLDSYRKNNRITNQDSLITEKTETGPSTALLPEIEEELHRHPYGYIWLMIFEGYSLKEISQKTNRKYSWIRKRKSELESHLRSKFRQKSCRGNQS